MHKGRVEHDFTKEYCNVKFKLKETIAIEKEVLDESVKGLNDYLHYKIKFIQYCFDEDLKFKHILITAIRKH
jgi:hypothetical protein